MPSVTYLHVREAEWIILPCSNEMVIDKIRLMDIVIIIILK